LPVAGQHRNGPKFPRHRGAGPSPKPGRAPFRLTAPPQGPGIFPEHLRIPPFRRGPDLPTRTGPRWPSQSDGSRRGPFLVRTIFSRKTEEPLGRRLALGGRRGWTKKGGKVVHHSGQSSATHPRVAGPPFAVVLGGRRGRPRRRRGCAGSGEIPGPVAERFEAKRGDSPGSWAGPGPLIGERNLSFVLSCNGRYSSASGGSRRRAVFGARFAALASPRKNFRRDLCLLSMVSFGKGDCRGESLMSTTRASMRVCRGFCSDEGGSWRTPSKPATTRQHAG